MLRFLFLCYSTNICRDLRDCPVERESRSVPICPDTFCVPSDRDRNRSLRDERDRDKIARDCPAWLFRGTSGTKNRGTVPSLAHPWSQQFLCYWTNLGQQKFLGLLTETRINLNVDEREHFTIFDFNLKCM